MLDGIPIGDVTGPVALSLIALLVITRRLVWHTDLKDERADKVMWRDLSLRLLGVAEKVTDQAEVLTSEVVTGPPAASPAREAESG